MSVPNLCTCICSECGRRFKTQVGLNLHLKIECLKQNIDAPHSTE